MLADFFDFYKQEKFLEAYKVFFDFLLDVEKDMELSEKHFKNENAHKIIAQQKRLHGLLRDFYDKMQENKDDKNLIDFCKNLESFYEEYKQNKTV
ncbi:hypothetical protein EHP00_373 [Ecytonucleospora hepatopenaei]|uniref:Uncharacterized protein n=1 Tax=Ecytonucleospora hepatopenaei TaxID=646526 RepID=A0A1W0E9B2_9MICR|nr:hypothetical protein EHP00_373 [Ecytonucleospora hepatopenaei]